MTRHGSDILVVKQCQHLLKRQITRSLLATFHELTGLRLRVWWQGATTECKPGDLAKLCPEAHQCWARSDMRERCKACFSKPWLRAWSSQEKEHRFRGLCGSVNYCARVKAADLRLVTLLVCCGGGLSPADNENFRRSVLLTRLIIHDLEATVRATQWFPGLGRPGALLETTRAPADALRGPQGRATGVPVVHWRRTNHVVSRILEYIHQQFPRPIQLADVASSVRMSPSYVSGLFSRATGVGFHRYLEQLRLRTAKDLLRDPVIRVSEVAEAIGYSNPNHFRNVFTARVGLSPSAWRDAALDAG